LFIVGPAVGLDGLDADLEDPRHFLGAMAFGDQLPAPRARAGRERLEDDAAWPLDIRTYSYNTVRGEEGALRRAEIDAIGGGGADRLGELL